MAEQMKGVFTRLRDGRWGVRVEGEMEKGTQMEVLCTKKDGAEEMVEVKSLWTGDNAHGEGKISLCSIIRPKKEEGEEAAEGDTGADEQAAAA